MVKIKSFVEYISENKNPPIASVTGPTVDINADYKSGQSLPNWDGLTSEEKKLFWDKGPIGRRIRLKAGMKYPDLITSDGLHQVADILALGLDFIFPPASSLIDILNGVSYAVEASLKRNKEEQNTYYLLSLISFAFAAAPGALQAEAIPLKAAIKSGKRVDKSLILGFINKIAPKIDDIFRKIIIMVDAIISETGLWNKLPSSITKKWFEFLKSRKVINPKGYDGMTGIPNNATKQDLAIEKFKVNAKYEVKNFVWQAKIAIIRLEAFIKDLWKRGFGGELAKKAKENWEKQITKRSIVDDLSKNKGLRMSGNLK